MTRFNDSPKETAFEKQLVRFFPAKNDSLAERIVAATNDRAALSVRSRRERVEKFARFLRACALILIGALIGSAATWTFTHRAAPEPPLANSPQKAAFDSPQTEFDPFFPRRIARRPETSGIPTLFADGPAAVKRWKSGRYSNGKRTLDTERRHP